MAPAVNQNTSLHPVTECCSENKGRENIMSAFAYKFF